MSYGGVPINAAHNAAQYLRMSTDMQRYSIENQSAAIAIYAARRGLTIVRSYEDAGKSGLRLEGRQGLQNLINDVTSRCADFSVILVYDVSRWGRFQDSDESAYHEFICRQAGISVEYCAEEFANDGSLTATIIKNIKRAMAAEFSRELSVKVQAGKNRLAAMGFRVGSAPGYGLRRYLVDADRKRKAALAPGEWKSITTDRVILVPGPPHEIETVKSIYRMFVDEGMTYVDIASRLNAEGSTNAYGRPWLPTAVRDVISNEKYIGNYVFNITSVKLGSKWRRNPRAEWIRAKGVFEAIIPSDLFELAQRLRKARRQCYTRNELLDSLTAILCQKGTLSVEILAASRFAPQPQAYQRYFGGLKNAYSLIGFSKPRVRSWARNQKFRTEMNNAIIDNVRQQGGSARLRPGGYVLRINDELSLATSVVRLITTERGYRRWAVGYRTHSRPDVLIVARVAEDRECLRDYFCIPYIVMGRNWLTFADENSARLEPFQMTSLAPLFDLFAREPVQYAIKAQDKSPGMSAARNPVRKHSAAWPTSGVEDSISDATNSLRAIMANGNFAHFVCTRGLHDMPRLLKASDAGQQAATYGVSVLNFAVVWAFVSRLMQDAAIAYRINCDWPELATEMKMTYLSVLTKGPFARVPHMKAFAEFRDESNAPIRAQGIAGRLAGKVAR